MGAVVVEPSADGVVVHASDGDYRSPTAVVACGAWAAKALAGLVELPPLLVTREQIFYFTPGDDRADWPSFIHHRAPAPYVYGLDTPGVGVKVAEHHTGAPTDADERSFDVDTEGRRRVAEYVETWFPGLRPEPVARRKEAAAKWTTAAREVGWPIDFGRRCERKLAAAPGSPAGGSRAC